MTASTKGAEAMMADRDLGMDRFADTPVSNTSSNYSQYAADDDVNSGGEDASSLYTTVTRSALRYSTTPHHQHGNHYTRSSPIDKSLYLSSDENKSQESVLHKDAKNSEPSTTSASSLSAQAQQQLSPLNPLRTLDHQQQKPRTSMTVADGDTNLLEQLDKAISDREGLQQQLDSTQHELLEVKSQNASMWVTLKKQRQLIKELRNDLQDMSEKVSEKIAEPPLPEPKVDTKSIQISTAESNGIVSPNTVQHVDANKVELPPPESPPKPVAKDDEYKMFSRFNDSDDDIQIPEKKRPPPIDLGRRASKGDAASTDASSPTSCGKSSSGQRPLSASSSSSPRQKETDKRINRLSMTINKLKDQEMTIKPGFNELPGVNVVVDSTVGPKRESSAVFSCRDADTGRVLWKISKDYNSLYKLDSQLRVHVRQYNVPSIPDRQLFNSNVPQKVDQRRYMLDEYFTKLMKAPLLPGSCLEAICDFLASDVETSGEPENTPGLHGYLLRKGQFTGWRAKYYVLEGPYLNCYDKPNGSLTGSINLYRALIGCQEEYIDGEGEVEYCHAFLIMELKKRDQYAKHILCAEHDADRDAWMNACAAMTETPSFCDFPKGKTMVKSKSSSSTLSAPVLSPPGFRLVTGDGGIASVTVLNPPTPPPRSNSNLSTVLSAATSSGEPGTKRPMSAMGKGSMSANSISSLITNDDHDSLEYKRRSGGRKFYSTLFRRNGSTPQQDEHYDDSGIEKALNQLARANEFEALSSDTQESPSAASPEPEPTVFNAPLSVSLEVSSHTYEGKRIPSIIYRCLLLLEHKHSLYEEGVFRINGSYTAVSNLRGKFNNERDVDLIALNAETNNTTGLMKDYLRKISGGVIPHDMEGEFQQAAHNTPEGVAGTAKLAKQLPVESFDLLYVLCGLFYQMIQNSALNKMTLRNAMIVLAPGMHIPTQVFCMLVGHYNAIFLDEPMEDQNRTTVDRALSNMPDI